MDSAYRMAMPTSHVGLIRVCMLPADLGSSPLIASCSSCWLRKRVSPPKSRFVYALAACVHAQRMPQTYRRRSWFDIGGGGGGGGPCPRVPPVGKPLPRVSPEIITPFGRA